MLDLKWQEMQWLTVASAAGDPDLALNAATLQHQVSDTMPAWLTLALRLRRNDRTCSRSWNKPQLQQKIQAADTSWIGTITSLIIGPSVSTELEEQQTHDLF